ncbi:MAG TPA: hemerythrin domain-containing protein [Terriglobia bacterium]|jgi:hemerythrin superfamily protein
MNAIEFIKQDHRRIEEFFENFLDAESEMTQDDLFREIETGLSAHSEMEEQALYPALQDIVPGKVDEALEEHAEVKELLADLHDADLTEEGFESGFRKLVEDVRHHVKEEEAPGGILEVAAESLSARQLTEIMNDMLRVQRSIKQDLAA